MQTIPFYVNTESILGEVRDYANAQNASAPTLTRGVSACLKMRLFASKESSDPYPLTDLAAIPAWHVKKVAAVCQVAYKTVTQWTWLYRMRLLKNFPNILDSAKHELGLTEQTDCDVYFQDEGIFGRMSNPAGCWSPKGFRPYLPLQRMREYDYVYTALCPKTGDLFSLILPESSNQCMQIFLNEFQAYRGKKTP